MLDEVLNFRPSPSAISFKDMLAKIPDIRDSKLNEGKTEEEVSRELRQLAIDLGWTEELYIEKVELYWKVYSE